MVGPSLANHPSRSAYPRETRKRHYLVATQAKLGNFDGAERILSRFRDPYYEQVAARHALAIGYAQSGNVERALAIVSVVGHDGGHILQDIAAVQVEQEGIANALKWIGEQKSINMSYSLIGAAEGVLKRPSLTRRVLRKLFLPE